MSNKDPESTNEDLPDQPATAIAYGDASGETSVASPVSSGTAISSRRLDFLRGAAALYVVFGHARGHLFAGGEHIAKTRPLDWLDYAWLALLQATSLGTEAVILFFVLSGFAMAHSVSRARSTKEFYIKRTIRIWPAYIAATVLAFGVAAIILNSGLSTQLTQNVAASRWDWVSFLAMAFYVAVDTTLTAQFWSLPHEIIFYAFCPLLLANATRVRVFWMLSALLTITSLVKVGIYDDPTIGGGVIYQHFFNLLIFFMTGAAAFHHQQYLPRVSGKTLLCVTIVGALVIWALKYQVFEGWNAVTSLLTAPLALLLIANLPKSIYEFKPLNWGHFSYSLYIFHLQLIMLLAFAIAWFTGLEQREMTSYWAWILAVPPVVFVCWLLYLVTERPCNLVLARIRARERREAAAAAPGGGPAIMLPAAD